MIQGLFWTGDLSMLVTVATEHKSAHLGRVLETSGEEVWLHEWPQNTKPERGLAFQGDSLDSRPLDAANFIRLSLNCKDKTKPPRPELAMHDGCPSGSSLPPPSLPRGDSSTEAGQSRAAAGGRALPGGSLPPPTPTRCCGLLQHSAIAALSPP